MNWLKSTTGMAIAVLVVILGIWKGQSIYDAARARWWGQKMASASVHGANADTAIKGADSAAVEGTAASREFDILTATPEIQHNPGAVKVATSARTVTAAKDKEIKNLRTAVAEKTKEVQDVRDAGEKPVPRISPYADIGYTRSLTKNYGVPVVRAGAVYRVIGWMKVQGELSYEPPPTISQARMDALDRINERDYAKAEIRATVTAHITF